MAASYLKVHMDSQHGISPPQTREVKIGEGGGGEGSYLCGFLPMGAEDSDMLSTRLSVSSA